MKRVIFSARILLDASFPLKYRSGEMGKKSKKRKSKKSSTSSEEDEKGSKDHDSSFKTDTRAKRREQDVRSQERYVANKERVSSPPVKDVSQSSRQIKKPVYRLAKTQTADKKPRTKEDECIKTKSASLHFHKGSSSKEKGGISGRYSVCEIKPVEKRSSKHLNITGAVPGSQKQDERTKGGSNEKAPPATSKWQRMSLSRVLAEQKDRSQTVQKRKHKDEEQPRSRRDQDTTRIRESCKTSSVYKHLLQRKESKLIKKLCPGLQNTEFKAKKNLYIDGTPAVSSSSSNPSKSIKSVPENIKSVSNKTTNSPSSQQPTCPSTSSLPPNFKIPKKVQLTRADCSAGSAHFKQETDPSKPGVPESNSKTLQQTHSCSDVTPGYVSERRDKKSCLSDPLPSASDPVMELWFDEMQVVEELHLARSEKRLEVDVLHSCGELTCMDIDPPEEGAANSHYIQPIQQDLIIVLDTNILLSHLDYVKQIISHGLGERGFPIVLIPWVVLQELDALKKGKGLSVGSVAHLAVPAISYILNSLKSKEPRLLGQSMQQAAQSSIGLNAENNDDRVLQCCLQYQSLYPECAVILCTNDKNLCSKALVSGVSASSKKDLEAEVGRSRRAFPPLQDIKTSALPQVSSPMLSTDYTSARPHSHKSTGLSLGLVKKDQKPENKKEDEEQAKWELSTQVYELEDCLREVLSDVLEVEMKAAFDDLWLEIVYIKPPWTLRDVLQCLKKHWVAVFGQVVPRRKLQTVLNLIDFFKSGKKVDCSSTLAALQDAKELVKAFWKSSGRVPSALSVLDNISKKLQPQGESPACDVIMTDEDKEDKPTTCAQVPHQEVWALFENIWSNVCQTSMDGFKALGFDPHTMQSSRPAGGPPPSQDALVCLHKLSSMVSQLLQAFSSILTSEPSLEEFQSLLSIFHSYEIVNADSRLTAKDLRDCFSQQDYREKLRVGGNQLMELKGALDGCIGTTVGQQHLFTT